MPHNVAHYAELEKSAAYIEGELQALGYQPQRASLRDRRPARCATSRPRSSRRAPAPQTESLVVGAHYDSAGIAPGANDNGTGVAAVLELARLLKDVTPKDKRLRLVLFVNEEPPYDRTPNMGSWRYAQMLKERASASPA